MTFKQELKEIPSIHNEIQVVLYVKDTHKTKFGPQHIKFDLTSNFIGGTRGQKQTTGELLEPQSEF